ncbi:MAG: hypothetical protein EYC70_07030 [Planctomycetota bacterium]|nr:MAG: hypothetical protein EYC70_07030 [Planctomycetota bacterium]
MHKELESWQFEFQGKNIDVLVANRIVGDRLDGPLFVGFGDEGIQALVRGRGVRVDPHFHPSGYRTDFEDFVKPWLRERGLEERYEEQLSKVRSDLEALGYHAEPNLRHRCVAFLRVESGGE